MLKLPSCLLTDFLTIVISYDAVYKHESVYVCRAGTCCRAFLTVKYTHEMGFLPVSYIAGIYKATERCSLRKQTYRKEYYKVICVISAHHWFVSCICK